MSAFGGARGVGAKPPEKGIFPLDHFGECKKASAMDGGHASCMECSCCIAAVATVGGKCLLGLPQGQ